MAIVVDHESEYKGERKVRDALAEYFSDDVVIYNNREVNGREYDICILVKDVCVFIVEVKGWLYCVSSTSNGSACTSKSYAPSYVLSAMGVPEAEIECSVRISWDPDTSAEELEKNLRQLIETGKQIKC